MYLVYYSLSFRSCKIASVNSNFSTSCVTNETNQTLTGITSHERKMGIFQGRVEEPSGLSRGSEGMRATAKTLGTA